VGEVTQIENVKRRGKGGGPKKQTGGEVRKKKKQRSLQKEGDKKTQLGRELTKIRVRGKGEWVASEGYMWYNYAQWGENNTRGESVKKRQDTCIKRQ